MAYSTLNINALLVRYAGLAANKQFVGNIG